MNATKQILTSEAYRQHASFWKLAIQKPGGGFQLRQHQRAYALPQSGRIEREVELPASALALIDDLSGGNDLGAFVVIAGGVFQILIAYSGSPVAQVESPCMAGESGSVPLIAEVPAEGTVREYLDGIRRTISDSYTYRDFPIADAARQSGNACSLSTNVSLRFEGVHASLENPERFEFAIEVSRGPSLRIHLTADAAAFSREYLSHFARHLGNVLAGYEDVDRPLRLVPLMDDAERSRYARHESQRALPAISIAEVFEQRAASQPGALAVVSDGAELTYAELNERANRLAHFLRSDYGLQTGDVVGVVSDASELWIAALLAVLKAGCVYLPLDPEYPEERLQFLMDDAGVRVLLIHSEQLPLLSAFYATPMFALDLQLDVLETPAANPAPAAQPHDGAYIIYTSGSTGNPKGVILEHRGFVNMALHHIAAFGIDASDRFSQFYSAGFDSSLFEVLVPLMAGGTVVTIPRTAIKDPAQFSECVQKHGVTTITAPPMYLAALDRGKLNSVRRIVSAGDNAKVEDAREFARNIAYYNSYGPTETTVCVTHHRVDPLAPYAARIPIGKAIDNIAIYLLDANLELVPEGCIGEICIAGVGLARGYLNRPDLTETAFVPNPFQDGERLYRTGDLGVWLPNGELELIGRKDTQVKIRGYRVELGEIEAVLAQHGRIRDAVVVVYENQPGEKRLAAYVTAHGPVTPADLREYLKNRLPEFMVPPVFVVLDDMPLTANGKIDRKALPAPKEAVAAGGGGDAPESEMQERVARIWAEVLGLDRVGIRDNFFELGGDSILIIQAVARANRAGIKLSAQQFFEHQTVAELAAVAVDARGVVADQGLVTGAVPLAPMQEWFFSQSFAAPHHFNQSVMLEVPPELAPEAVQSAVDGLLKHHDALRLRFVEIGDRWEQRYDVPAAEIPFTWSNVSTDQEVERRATEIQSGMDLARGPLIHVHLFRRPESAPSLLLVAVHHLAIDGVSWRILLEDLCALCHGAELPAKTSSFMEWSSRLHEFSRTDFEGLSHWRHLCAAPVTAIPKDRAGSYDSNTFASAADVRCSLDRSRTHDLLHEAPRAFNTRIDDILLTALLLTFMEWTGSSELLVDMEGHGREDLFPDLDCSRTAGWFTALYPVLLRGESGASPVQSLKAVKEQLRAIPLRGLGYGLARYLRRDAEVLAQPAAEVLFNYLGQTDRVLTAGDTWKPVLGLNGPEAGSANRRSHLLEINGIVSARQLAMTWTFSGNMHDRATIERLAQRYAGFLGALVDSCRTADSPAYTPSDFPGARLDQKELDALIAGMGSS
jgi:amino acid adenylation domain-containing protein/non-ribosomal peptide synthase protein (TIGR01720 family)